MLYSSRSLTSDMFSYLKSSARLRAFQPNSHTAFGLAPFSRRRLIHKILLLMSNPGLLMYRRAPSKPSLEQTATRGHCFQQASVTLASDASSSSSQCEPGGRNLADNHKGDSPHISPSRIYLVPQYVGKAGMLMLAPRCR